jgi:nucleoside-diphosphate-sugar epimerase
MKTKACKSYLVTGGAGFLGINLIRHLLAQGQRVTSLDIAEFKYEDVKNEVNIITGDIRDENAVADALKGIDIVVHGAAALPLYPERDILSTNIEGTRIVLQQSYNKKVEKVIHISSTAVYGIPDHHPLRENDALSGVGPYGKSKVAAESICMEFLERGMNIPILRPKSFIGPERLGVFAMLYEWAHEGRNFPILGKGDNFYQYLDVADLCDAIWLCATLPHKEVNDIFNVGAEKFGTPRTDFQAILDYAGNGGSIVSLPQAPVIFMLQCFEKLGISPLYEWIYKTAGKDSYVSIEKAKRILGFEPKYSNRDALIRNYKWYLDNLSRMSKSAGVTHRTPWQQGILTLAKLFF